ncbi:MAG: hypothetical protein K8F91_16510 [Candidatus Obscuribacterales bacterium]|nr:hypothetical protein [Candidatus Obscuribacterales bacterium]
MTQWICVGISTIMIFGALWAILTGAYSARTKSDGTKTLEFDQSPVRYSLTLGVYITIALFVLFYGKPDLQGTIIAKIPQMKEVFMLQAMNHGHLMLFAGSVVFFAFFSIIARKIVVSLTTYSQGKPMDMDEKLVQAYERRKDKDRF